MDGALPLSPPDLDVLVVHPLAAIFPMLADDELAELAADIAANGLLHPIVRTLDGKTIVDGRNRLEACKRAGIDPTFDDRIASDDEARTLIVSANLQRRNMSKGQQAMALATIYPEASDKGGRGIKRASETDGVSATRLKLARLVLRLGPDDLAPAVLSGAFSLDTAYTEAQRRRNAANSEQGKLAKLQTEAPDLVALVTEERMTLDEAFAAFEQRQADAKARETSQRETLLRLTESAYRGITAWAVPEFVAELDARISDKTFRDQFDSRVRVEPDRVSEITAGAKQLVQFLRRLGL